MQPVQKGRTNVPRDQGDPVAGSLAREVMSLRDGVRCFCCGGIITAGSASKKGTVLACETCGAEVAEVEGPGERRSKERSLGERLNPAA
jgi:DNA-directed RNA polymerase subunit N (RpoN/RPB10)